MALVSKYVHSYFSQLVLEMLLLLGVSESQERFDLSGNVREFKCVRLLSLVLLDMVYL